MEKFCTTIWRHYESVWQHLPNVRSWDKGPLADMPSGFRVLEFQPTNSREMWTYATCCMSTAEDVTPLELHIFSPIQSELVIELLTAVAHFHRTGSRLALGHTVNFGRPWLPGSQCNHGLVSLPYMDGTALERLNRQSGAPPIRFLWLIPISERERDYKIRRGLEALEEKLEGAGFNYLDPLRESVV